MGDYDSGYDPKYGYNRNAFAHKTIGTAVMGRIVKLIVTPIGLGSEAIHHYRDKKKRSASQSEKDTGAITAPSAISAEAGLNEPASPSDAKDNLKDKIYVNVPADQADELVASKQAVRADGATVTHELVPEDNQDDGIERDEVDWALDEAASETEEKEGPDAPNETLNAESTDQRASQSMLSDKSQAGKQAKAPPPKRLPFPVILPQRRPGTKARGFVRAYAPVLQDSGIGQESFVRFLKDFHRAAQASPVFNVIMIATAIAGAYPDILVGLAVQAVQIAAGVGQEIQERYRTNKFLDQANRNIFMPKGLFALIVTCKPGKSDQAEVSTETIDIGATAMVKYGGALDQAESTADSNERLEEQRNKVDEMKEKMKRLRIASGATSEAEIPITCAPLIFPALDAIVDASNQEGLDGEGVATNIKTKAKASSKFVSDYFDRRAQATYAVNNPQSTLTAQMGPAAPQFKSRFADPNDHTNMHFFTLITGGRYKAEPLGARRRYERAQRKAEQQGLQRVKEKSSNRMLKEGVLYLMVVNMPTEEELEKARKHMKEAKEKKAVVTNVG